MIKVFSDQVLYELNIGLRYVAMYIEDRAKSSKLKQNIAGSMKLFSLSDVEQQNYSLKRDAT